LQSSIWCGCPYIQLARASAHAGPRREGTLGWNRRCIDFAAPTAEQLADGLNAPAFVAAAFLDPLRSRMHLGCAEFHYSGHAATALCVPLLWYFIGRLIDNSDSARLRRYTRARKFWAYLAVFLLSAAAALVVASFFLASALEFLVVRVCMLGWIAAGIVTLVARLRGVDHAGTV
jgi:hypothetical protein